MKLSVVSTLYQSSAYIEEFHRRVSAAALEMVGENYEIILVNDGSPDDSLEIALALVERDPRLSVVDLSRNFGHHKAMMTGLAHSTGDWVYLIDVDLEEEPEWLAEFNATMQQQQCDVVYGVQLSRKGGLFEKVSGGMFYWLFNKLTDIEMPKNIVTARLMTKRYVEALLLHEEREVFLAGLWRITGFKQVPYVVTKLSHSETSYSFRRKFSIFVNSITSFSSYPLIGIFYFGLIISLIAGGYATLIVFQLLLGSEPPSGWTSLIVSVWLLGGLIISFVGIIGIYMAKVYTEVKSRPYTIVKDVHEKK